MSTQAVQPMTEVSMSRPRRFVSVDLLRGLTIAFMILVNDNASDAAYWPLQHAEWNGLTPTDLVFPTFLFLVGVSIVLSTAKRLQQGANRASLLFHVVRRAIIIFLLGLVVNSAPLFHLATLRYYGVLPRIAICYLIVGTFYILAPGWRSKVVALVGVLLAYWILMRFVPVPGYGMPGRDVPLLDKDGNLVAWLDRHIFSAPHLYERTRDPEGLLSTLPALGTALIGVLTGLWLNSVRPIGEKARGIFIAGLSILILGALWNFTFPINKKMWTSSYVLAAGGISMLLLALFIWIADLRTRKDEKKAPWFYTPFLVFGTNAISAYVLSELLASGLPYMHAKGHMNPGEWFYVSVHKLIPDAAFSSLIYSLTYVAVCWLVVYVVLYRRKIFLKV
jgi:predicted acyltransferase